MTIGDLGDNDVWVITGRSGDGGLGVVDEDGLFFGEGGVLEGGGGSLDLTVFDLGSQVSLCVDVDFAGDGRDGNTEGGGVVSGCTGWDCGIWGQGGPWFGWNVSCDGSGDKR